VAAQIDEVSSALPWGGRIMVIGDTQRYVSIRQCLAHTNWDDGIRSCIGGAQEEVSGESPVHGNAQRVLSVAVDFH
jgi:hypothetical protein